MSALSRLLSDHDLKAYLALIRSQPRLTHAQLDELARRARAGDEEARNAIMLGNLRLVLRLAAAWIGRGVDPADLVAEGNVGLMRAAEKFDPDMGCCFSTYATWWITQSIRKAVRERSHVMRVPSGAIDEVARWRSGGRELSQRLDRKPTEAEVAAELGLSPRVRRRVSHAVSVVGSTVHSLHDLPESADLRCTPDEGVTERLAAEGARLAAELLDTLDERSRIVVIRRLGLDGGEPATLVVLAERLGISRERVRQIEREALARLRRVLSSPRQVA